VTAGSLGGNRDPDSRTARSTAGFVAGLAVAGLGVAALVTRRGDIAGIGIEVAATAALLVGTSVATLAALVWAARGPGAVQDPAASRRRRGGERD
jgi:hypothetical protein